MKCKNGYSKTLHLSKALLTTMKFLSLWILLFAAVFITTWMGTKILFYFSLPEFRLPYLAPIHISPVSHVKYIPNAPNKILDPLNQHYERANTDKYSTNVS